MSSKYSHSLGRPQEKKIEAYEFVFAHLIGKVLLDLSVHEKNDSRDDARTFFALSDFVLGK